MSSPTPSPSPASPGATVAPAAGAPLATTPNPGASEPEEGGIMKFVKGLFFKADGSFDLTGTLTTVGMGALGAYMGGGAGLIGMLLGGVGGAIGGSLLSPLVSKGVDFIGEKVFGIQPSRTFSRAGPRDADPNVAIRTGQSFLQSAAPTVDTTLITPNLDSFAGITSDNAGHIRNLETRRQQIENMRPGSAARIQAMEDHLGHEGVVAQYIANADSWNKQAAEWNGKELPQVTAAYNSARKGLGFDAPAAGAAGPLREAPTGALDIDIDHGSFLAKARQNYPDFYTDRPFDELEKREQLVLGSEAIEKRIAQLANDGTSAIDWEEPGTSLGRKTNNVLSLGGNFSWFGAIKIDDRNTHELASDWHDRKRDTVRMLKNAHNIEPSVAELDRAIGFARHGESFAAGRNGGTFNEAEQQNFARLAEYAELLKARKDARAAHSDMNQSVINFHGTTGKDFATYVGEVNDFRTDVNQMNQQIASLNQSQTMILDRGQVPGGPADQHFVTIRDRKNNQDVTIVGKETGGVFNATHAFRGSMDAAKLADATSALPAGSAIADIFTDKGVMTTANLGQAIRTALAPIHAKLGIATSPTVTPTTTVVPPLSTPAPAPAPGGPAVGGGSP